MAYFEEPFEFLSKNKVSPNEARPTHQWGSWTVVERFPSQVSWKAPTGSSQYLRSGGDPDKEGYPLHTNGLVQCTHCHSNKKHKLNWPNDAYWQWEIRGKLLWAWHSRHAHNILEFVRKTDRPSRYNPDLTYVPSHFLSAKIRDLVVKKIEDKIGA